MSIAEPEQILDLWIGTAATDAEAAKDKTALWFRKSDETDDLLRTRFGDTLEVLRGGLTETWRANGPRPCLAAIIALDQFSRNIYRGTAQAFANDALALQLARETLETSGTETFTIVERLFLLLPLEHAEDATLQARCVKEFEDMVTNAPPDFRPLCEDWLDYAYQHKAIIDQFGRFPHRNALLGRESTKEELEYLATPGSGF